MTNFNNINDNLNTSTNNNGTGNSNINDNPNTSIYNTTSTTLAVTATATDYFNSRTNTTSNNKFYYTNYQTASNTRWCGYDSSIISLISVVGDTSPKS